MIKYLVVLLFLFPPLFAQSRFDGTWQMQMETLRFSGSPEEYLLDQGMYHCLSCTPRVDVKMDGLDHRVAGHEAYYDTIAVRILNPRTVRFTFKKGGKPAAVSTETVSADGLTMAEEFTNNMEAEAVSGKAGFMRVSKGPPARTHFRESGACRRSTMPLRRAL